MIDAEVLITLVAGCLRGVVRRLIADLPTIRPLAVQRQPLQRLYWLF
jgi:hypothetical protein